jgi:PRTRC genetic system protein A
MSQLTNVFAGLVQHHIATPTCPLPACQPGIAWIWAANGIWKRGIDGAHDILIRVAPTSPTPGLAQLVPHARSTKQPDRIPGGLLTALLDHARRAGDASGIIARPIEQQYFITYRQGLPQPFRLAAPTQDASAASVRYEMPKQGQRLIDIHSHLMAAFFSSTDDRDDTGLSISAVVGRIFSDHPEIAIRANVYGHHQPVPALTIFDHLPTPLCEADLKRKDDDAALID